MIVAAGGPAFPGLGRLRHSQRDLTYFRFRSAIIPTKTYQTVNLRVIMPTCHLSILSPLLLAHFLQRRPGRRQLILALGEIASDAAGTG